MSDYNGSQTVVAVEAEQSGNRQSVRPRRRRSHRDATAYDTLLWRLQAKRATLGTEQSVVIGFTGSGWKSGTTTVAANVAIRASEQQEGRVLLIEANWRSPKLRKAFQLTKGPGLFEVLAGEVSLQDCPQQGNRENLDVMLCGNLQSGEEPWVNQQNLVWLLNEVRADYDLVVLDLPPAHCLGPLLQLTRNADGVLFVLRSESVHKKDAQRIVNQLVEDGVPMWGTVLNKHREYVPRWLKKWF